VYIKRACLFGLVLLVILIIIYSTLLSRLIDFPGNLIFGFFCAFFMAMAIGMLFSIRGYREEMRIIRESGLMPAYKDGARIAVHGYIYPINGQSVKSPFTDQDSVAYEYRVRRQISKSDGQSEKIEFFGYCLIPCVIRTMYGDVKLLAWPDMRNYKEEDIEYDRRRQAADYLLSTPFRLPDKSSDEKAASTFSQLMTEMKELFNDDDGSIRIDNTTDRDRSIPTGEKERGDMVVRIDPDQRLHFETSPHLRFSEKCVPSGETVCLIGTWSDAKRGIVSEMMNKGKMPTLFRGNGDVAIAELKSKIRRAFIFGVGTSLVVNLVLWFLFAQI